MALIDFDHKRERDVVIIGRATLDFNPNEIHRTLDKVKTFSMYLGGSPGNIAVGLNQLGKKVGFIGCVSNDQFGDFVINFFKDRGIDTTQMTRAKHGERMGLTFTEIKSPTESSILMYRDKVADLQIAPEDVSENYIAGSKALIVSGLALAAAPSREACLTAAQYARMHVLPNCCPKTPRRPPTAKSPKNICRSATKSSSSKTASAVRSLTPPTATLTKSIRITSSC